jgi:hypothetical protein
MKLPSARVIIGYIAIVVSLTAIFTGFASLKQSRDLTNALIEACETNRPPQQAFYASQLAESEAHGINYYRQRFPDFPPDELRAAIKKQRDQLRTLVDALDPSGCEEQYR